LFHRGVLVATHAQRHDPGQQTKADNWGRRSTPAPKRARTATAASVTRKVDSSVSERSDICNVPEHPEQMIFWNSEFSRTP
jgi:hypothetical protein